MSCYSCKTHLYSALKDIHHYTIQSPNDGDIVLFNGTNKDDLKDPTRVGLIAAKEFRVAQPLDEFTKAEVRDLARELGLPNAEYAASPCLRSRLAYGVRATDENLKRIENAEIFVKELICPEVWHNTRVRHLKDGGARIELDTELLTTRANTLPHLADKITTLGFKYVKFSEFKSGSVAAVVTSGLTGGLERF